ncbi:hypothetical protein HMPREF1042_0822 [Streptococcus constellatus subsp. pharyngis SK1060 = CCUG 46377]|uniref:Uncharacterized protein n=1 Tax=Streptococcus constellatus subsp. pharyngis SK1060 = CCUG 46377 TaxID=1035184 RepID=F9P5R5_STRCV|nr:hypothetical protein HMPREF1042_0822 [Streptococcus constellatus subsp. pharyngis SK1060 = CCUG 46377]
MWIRTSISFCVIECHPDDKLNMVSLAVFSGLLFLLIFENKKIRYLIQFLQQIIV